MMLSSGAIRALSLALAFAAHNAVAQEYPSKPIRMVVPFEAGGTIDVIGRAVAGQITRSGINIYMDNKPGANTIIGTDLVAKAPPDGYTFLNVSPSFVLNTLISKKLPYDIFKDFVPITALGVGTGYLLVVRKDLPVKSVAELTTLARKKEDGLTYGTPGIGNALHVATEMFASAANVRMLHVPFKGSASALNAIVAGQVDVMILSPATVTQVANDGKLRVLAFTGEQRSREFPDVPTMREAGMKDFVIKGTWVGWFAPAGTPPAVIDKLHAEASKALKDPQVAKLLAEGGFERDGRAPAEFATFVRNEFNRFGEVVKRAKIQAD